MALFSLRKYSWFDSRLPRFNGWLYFDIVGLLILLTQSPWFAVEQAARQVAGGVYDLTQPGPESVSVQ